MVDMVNLLSWQGRLVVGMCLCAVVLGSSGLRAAEVSVGGGGEHFPEQEKPDVNDGAEPITDGGSYSGNPDSVVIDGRTVNPGRLIGKWKGDVTVSEGAETVEAMGLLVSQTFASMPLLVILEPLSREVIGAANYVPLDTADDISRQIRELLGTGLFEYIEPDWAVGVDGPEPSDGDGQTGHEQPDKEGDDTAPTDGGSDQEPYDETGAELLIDGRLVNPGRLFAKWKSDVAATAGRAGVRGLGVDVAKTFHSIPLLVVLEPLPLDVVGADRYVPLETANGIREQIGQLMNTGWFEYVEPDWAVGVEGSQPGEGSGSIGIGGGESTETESGSARLSIEVDSEAGVLILEHEVLKSAKLQMTLSLLDPVWEDIAPLNNIVSETVLDRTQWRIEAAGLQGFYRVFGE